MNVEAGNGPPSARSPTTKHRIPVAAAAVVLLLASLLVTECGVYCENHAVQAPLVEWIKNPALYPNDPFVGALARYPSLLWPMVAFVSRAVPLEPLLLTLFMLERLFVIAAAGILARTLAPRSYLAPIAAMAVFAFAVGSLIGGGTIVDRYFEQTGLAIAFFLLAISAFHAERPLLWGVCMGAAFALNSLYACYALTYFGAGFLVEGAYRRSWRRWAPGVVAFLALSAYPIYRGLAVLRGPSPEAALWLAAARARCWRHLFPLDWGPWPFLRFFGFLALLGAVLVLGERPRGKLFRLCATWSGVACLWLLFAFIAAYGIKRPDVLMLQPARATDLWVAMAAVVGVSVCSRKIESMALSAATSFGLWGWCALFGILFLFWHPTGWIVVLGLLLLSTIVSPVRRYLFSNGAPRRVAFLLMLWACLAGVADFRSRLMDSRTFTDALVHSPDRAVRRIAAWAQANTPVDALFLVNLGDFPDWDQFRGLSQRSIVTNWEEGTAIYWDRGFAPIWVDRLEAFGFDPTKKTQNAPEIELSDRYTKLSDEDIERVRTRFPLQYWIVPTGHPSRFPTAFQALGYKVLDCS